MEAGIGLNGVEAIAGEKLGLVADTRRTGSGEEDGDLVLANTQIQGAAGADFDANGIQGRALGDQELVVASAQIEGVAGEDVEADRLVVEGRASRGIEGGAEEIAQGGEG